ncbi:DNA damage-binding protein 1a [Tanacetum coccineum]
MEKKKRVRWVLLCSQVKKKKKGKKKGVRSEWLFTTSSLAVVVALTVSDGCNDDFRHRYGDLENGGDNGSRNACKALVKGGPWPESREVVESGAYMLIAVPLSIGGVVMIGRNKIVYYIGSTIEEI